MNNIETVEISVVVPVFNEEENLPVLIPKLVEVLNNLGYKYEMIFVDDGSYDESRAILKRMKSQYPMLRIIGLKENRGLSTALIAGIKEAKGDRIVTLDSDLQNDPEDIPRLLGYLDQYDMATGWREKREDPWLKRVSSKVANRIRNLITKEEVKDSACTLRAFKKKCFRDIPIFNGMHRFLPTLFKMNGLKVIEVPVSHHPRRFGKSKYNIRNRAFKSFCDLMGVSWLKKRRIQYEVDERI